jgi:hypothetical protein
MALPYPPTLEGYIDWVRNIMGVDEAHIADDDPYLEMSYDVALEIVNRYLFWASPGIYTIAVYNLGGDFLCNIAQDDTSTPPGTYPTYWADLRNSLNLNSFVPGLVNAANDEDTSAATMVPLGMQNLTVADLQTLKTPWGRTYMGIAQSVGSMWGLS